MVDSLQVVADILNKYGVGKEDGQKLTWHILSAYHDSKAPSGCCGIRAGILLTRRVSARRAEREE